MKRKANIILARTNTPLLTYEISDDVNIGDIVVVPFHNKEFIGVVESFCDEDFQSKFKIKEIIKKTEFSIQDEYFKFIYIFCRYYLIDKSSALKMLIPISVQDFDKYKPYKISPNLNIPRLNKEQEKAFEEISSADKVSLLFGVTGSGKTEIYFHLIKKCLDEGKQTLLMLPEIGLTNQIIERFEKAFGFKPVIWHSKTTPAKKRDGYIAAIKGDAKVIIGTRSSMFLPFQNLGLIVIDEEHDPSYKQEELSLYNARDASILRSSIFGFKTLLVSATPSIESINNVNLGKFHISHLSERYANAKLPEINIVSMKNEEKNKWISSSLKDAIKEAIENKKQAILFINRRGYAPLVLCKGCSYRYTCSLCSSWLVYHKSQNQLNCHHCGYFEKYPQNCSECGSEDLIQTGPGVERIYEEIHENFRDAKICLLSKDHIGTNDDLSDEIKKIEQGDYDIIIGTQIITKGYHFPKVTVVGVIDADLGEAQIDLKANERCFQIINQVAGRAGRGEDLGKVFVQTYFPDNPIFDKVEKFDLDGFYNVELESRKDCFFPPFSRAISIIVTGKEEIKTREFSKIVKNKFKETDQVRILGPAPATMSKIRGDYRFRILILADKKIMIQKYIEDRISRIKKHNFNIRIEVDPNSFY